MKKGRNYIGLAVLGLLLGTRREGQQVMPTPRIVLVQRSRREDNKNFNFVRNHFTFGYKLLLLFNIMWVT
jgi:hypothetical protein